jgi:G:T/U-mismatch repair DNA glycosylase
MATAFDTPVVPFAGPFADLQSQFLEASTRALSASAEIYTQVLQSQADATRELIEAYAGLGGQVVQAGAETAERAEQATTQVARGTGRAAQRATRRATTATRKAVKQAKPATPATAVAAAVLEAPITGYDDLTAEEIVAKLPEQPQATLVQVAAYERAHDKRSTVLERVAALTGPQPAPGYDELTADEVQKLLTGGDAALATAVRDYERRHKSRASVLEAAARNAEQS